MKNLNTFVRVGMGLMILCCLQSCQNKKKATIAEPISVQTPLLVTEYCGPSDSIYRAGKPGVYEIRIKNAGETPATGIKIRFLSNGELLVDRKSVKSLPDTILPTESRTIYFNAVAKRVIDLPVASFKVTVECNEGVKVDALTKPVKIYPAHE